MFDKVGGRKFVLVVSYALVVILNDKFRLGISAQALHEVLIAVAGFVGVEGVADVVERLKK